MAALLFYGLTQPRIVRFTSFDFATLRSGRTGGGNPCILSVAPVGAKSKGLVPNESQAASAIPVDHVIGYNDEGPLGSGIVEGCEI